MREIWETEQQFEATVYSDQDDHLPLYEIGIACPINKYSIASTTQELHIPFRHTPPNVDIPFGAICTLLEANPRLQYVDIMIEQFGSHDAETAVHCSLRSVIANGDLDLSQSFISGMFESLPPFPDDELGQARDALKTRVEDLYSSESEDVFVVLAHKLSTLQQTLRERGRNVEFSFYPLSNHTPEEITEVDKHYARNLQCLFELGIAVSHPRSVTNLDTVRRMMTEFLTSESGASGDLRNHRMIDEVRAHMGGPKSGTHKRATVLAYGARHQAVFFQRAEDLPEGTIALWPRVEVEGYCSGLHDIGVHGIPNRISHTDYYARYSTRREVTEAGDRTGSIGENRRMSLEDVDRALFGLVLSLALRRLPGASCVNPSVIGAAAAQAAQMIDYSVIQSTLFKIIADTGNRSMVSSFVALFPRVFDEGREDAMNATVKLEQVYCLGADRERLSTLFPAPSARQKFLYLIKRLFGR